MLAKSYVVLFLVILFVLCNGSFDAKHQENQTMNNIQSNLKTNISLKSAMPLNAKWVNFDCGEVGRFVLPSEKAHYITWIPIDQDLSCHVNWGHSEATVTVFDAKIDHGHLVVNWLIRPDGFYHSLDNFFWDKRASWEH
ncbi:putative plant self-incompatibility S1 [Medicago truncatula]|uniref:Leguminosin group486 secreted peptide n=1 Tax=Medicago truncatula TaxID=3880 RepID=A0A072U8M6_MEDTR|nr:leguminosin group486 secreted peptide [Medicago truncatula]RHN45208.1 putative plant self-incompatibility S1 [Medicago truncatula]